MYKRCAPKNGTRSVSGNVCACLFWGVNGRFSFRQRFLHRCVHRPNPLQKNCKKLSKQYTKQRSNSDPAPEQRRWKNRKWKDPKNILKNVFSVFAPLRKLYYYHYYNIASVYIQISWFMYFVKLIWIVEHVWIRSVRIRTC